MKKQNKGTNTRFAPTIYKAFTLVELIVVITILAILGTIAFISLQGYSRDARDSTRLSDINNIEKQLELFLVKTGTLPIPENNVELQSPLGTTKGYQGYAGKTTLGILKVFNGGLDPVDQTPYIYRINASKRAYQIMGFLENGNQTAYIPSPIGRGLGGGLKGGLISGGRGLGGGLFPQANAATDLTNRFPLSKGKVLGIILEQTTHKPFQDIKTGIVDMRTDLTLSSTILDVYLTNNIIKKGNIKNIYGTLENLASSQKFDKPSQKCPTGFIPVPGNMDFGQPAFCVAKYEMSYAGLTQTDNSGDWNTYSYLDNAGTIPVLGGVVSQQGNSPIAEINQSQAIAECMAIGPGYHLITNNEWMSLARDIEKQPVNWSGGVVGTNYLFNGISNGTSGCSGNASTNLPTASKWATITGDTNCSNKNRLTLSNGEQIWDLAGNVWEHVNKTNTLDGTNSASGTTTLTGSLNGVAWDDDGKYNKSDMNKYGSILGYGTAKGMGNLYYANGVANNNFIRGGHANRGSDDGIFALYLTLTAGSANRTVGFRCTR